MRDGLSRLRLSHRQRLRSRADFLQVRRDGLTVRGRFFTVGVRTGMPQGDCRIGVVTTRRYGKAVARTAVRRLVRELFRIHQHEFLKPMDMVVVPKTAANKVEKILLREELMRLWKKAGVLLF